MKEIKFKAWDKEKHHLVDEVVFIDYKAQQIGCHKIGYGSYCQTFNNIILMPFTGLKDCNSKEIYEGDIVNGRHFEYNEYWNENVAIDFISDIKYIDNAFSVHRDSIGYEGRIKDYGYVSSWYSNNVEIIGNIYENPELLKED